MDLVPCAFYYIAESAKEFEKCLQLTLIRVFMNTVNKWNIEPVKMLSNRFICSQHKLLNQSFPYRTFTQNNILHFSRLIYKYLSFLKIKINSTAAHSFPI